MGVTAKKFVELALSYEGYREKNHATADLYDFLDDAGDGNHTFFQQISVGWTGDQWCQYFVDGIAILLTGSKEAAKTLLCQENLSRLTGYTPDGSQCFKDAGRWHTKDPKLGDIVYFWSNSKGRIGHTGVVIEVDERNMIAYTIEGNSNTVVRPDGDVETNGGEVARHSYYYGDAGQPGAKIQGFGRPRYDEDVSGATLRIGGNMSDTYKLETVKRGSSGTSVLLVQEILKAREIKQGVPYYKGKLDREFGTQTEQAVRDYQTIRIAMGAKIGGADGKADGEVGPATWNDLLGLQKI